VVHIEESNRQIHVNMRPGTVMTPLLESATGRCFAAFLPERIVGPLVADELARIVVADRPASPAAEHEVAAVLDEVRRHRLARALGQPIPGINAFSAPVFNHSGQIALALTAMGPAGSFDTDWDGDTARRVKACAEAIGHRLGNPRPA
jgi:DNA-binding IclR family transcriptional regulator